MKKLFPVSLRLALVFLTTGIALAHGVGYGFTFFFALPPIVIGPPAVVVLPSGYDPPSPDYEYPPPPPAQSYRSRQVRVPGHWEGRP